MKKRNKYESSLINRLAMTSVIAVFAVFASVSTALASGGQLLQSGVVDSRALVVGPNKGHIFVEYDPKTGAIVKGWSVETVNKDAKDWVMSGDEYKLIVSQYAAYMQSNQNSIARGAHVITAQEYNSDRDNGKFYGVGRDSSGNPVDFPVTTPALLSSTKSVLVRSPDTIPDSSVLDSTKGVILMQFPVDLTASSIHHLADNILSMLLNGDGQVIRESTYNIALRAAFLPPVGDDTTHDDVDIGRPGVTPLSPLVDAKITSNRYSSYTTYTQPDGKFHILLTFPPCPWETVEYSYSMNVGLHYTPFNPQSSTQSSYYYFQSVPGYYFCNGLGEIPLGSSLYAVSAKLDILGTIAVSATALSTFHIPVDVTMLSGTLEFANVTNTGKSVPSPDIGTDSTEYHDDAPAVTMAAPTAEGLDFNGDGNAEGVTYAPSPSTYWIAKVPVASTSSTPKSVSIGRVPDYAPDFDNEGLLHKISLDDAKNTSLYVYRKSTGQLIASQDKLSKQDVTTGIDGKTSLHYRLVLPGSQGWDAAKTNVTSDPWDIKLAAPKDKPHQIDSLRPGEQVEVVAVNRATGYIGTATISLQPPAVGQLDVNKADIKLAPPNLKLHVERTYSRQGSTARHAIGYQGSGLTSDTYVVVKTDWQDRDGTPLPNTPDGFTYTGRLSKVVDNSYTLKTVTGSSDTTAAASDALAEFTIAPGQHTQVVLLKGIELGTSHFYVHVSGTPKDAKPSFSTPDNSGDGKGPRLAYRPSHYVPLRVPVFDEAATNTLRNETLYTDGDLSAVSPIYKWPYRPEMEFSVMDLKLGKLTIDSKIPGTPAQTIDVNTASASDIMTALFNQNDLKALLNYTLNGSTYKLLPEIGAPPQQYVFALGGDEQQATVDKNGNITFANLGSLDDVQGADLLALSLYDNSDSSNILWQVSATPIYVQKQDPQYPNVPLRWNDYYPALGNKTITVISDLAAKGLKVRAQILNPQPGEALLSDTGQSQAETTSTLAMNPADGQYEAQFKLSAPGTDPSVGQGQIKIQFTLLLNDSQNPQPSVTDTWHIRNNSNTTLADVLEGKAVFAYDKNSKDISRSDAITNTQGLDYVQELLNQVIPRKRNVIPGTQNIPVGDYPYLLISEDGNFDDTTADAVHKFKKLFNVDNTSINGANNSYQKLAYDYGYTKANQLSPDSIIDKETLVGKAFNKSDTAINVDTKGDTGLYELYVNVVKPFVDKMISEATRYTSNEVTQAWQARVKDIKDKPEAHGLGVSYCFGCKNSIAQFNSNVVNCVADISKTSYLGDASIIKDSSGNPTLVNGIPQCELGKVGAGKGQWAGLFEHELYQYKSEFNPDNWAGIDCSGFVQRTVGVAEDFENNEGININADIQSPQSTWVSSTSGWINSQHFFPILWYASKLASGKYIYSFDDTHNKTQGNSRVFYLMPYASKQDNAIQISELHRGDLVQYAGHIAIVYSESVNGGNYEIISALGNYHTIVKFHGHKKYIFARKVIISGPDIASHAPFGYGRIRLWN